MNMREGLGVGRKGNARLTFHVAFFTLHEVRE
jgi:hypothetical protein